MSNSPSGLRGWLVVPGVLLTCALLTIATNTEGLAFRLSYWSSQSNLFLALNDHLSRLPEQIWLNCTLLGDGSVLIPLLSPLLIWCPRAWAAVLGSIPMAAVFSIVGKNWATIPRPAAVLDNAAFQIIGDTLTGHNSLPSGHAITVFAGAIAVIATLFKTISDPRDALKVLTVLSVVSVLSLSRVAVGAHWPMDIVVGAALGWVAGLSGLWIALRFPNWWQLTEESNRRYLVSAALLLASLSLILRNIDSPDSGPILWFAALCGVAASHWLSGSQLASFGAPQARPVG